MKKRNLILSAVAALGVVLSAAHIATAPALAATTVIQDTNQGTGIGQVQFSANWNLCTTTCAKAADNSYRWTSTAGSTATVRFSGSRIALFGVKEPWSNIATVSIDGGSPVDVDFYANPTSATVVQVYQSPVLAETTHTLVLTMTSRRNPASSGGNAITFDRAEVTADGSTPPPTGQPPLTGNRSGLTWASGIGHLNQTQSVYDGFGTWRGRSIDVAKVFPVRSTWNDIVGPNSFIYNNFAAFPGRLAIAVPLFPSNIANATGLSQCAAGQYNDEWATFGNTLVSKSRGTSVIQLGWEFNGTYMYWYASNTTQWIQCFRNAATAIRSTAPGVLIDWTMNGHATPAGACGGSAWNCYPGDAYVDIVGIHDYDHYPPALTVDAFNSRANGSHGLNSVHSFAVAHGKWMSVLEWGVNNDPNDGANGGKDNPLYIQLQRNWFADHDVESGGRLIVEAYYDDGCVTGNVRSSLTPACNPNSAVTYNNLY